MPESDLAAPPRKASFLRPLIFVLLLGGIIAVVRLLDLHQYMEQERLRAFIQTLGIWGPAMYLAIWTLAPPLFLPGLPITLAGGVLFGPVWGVIYTALGATAGATLAAVVARYLARDWVAAKLAGTKLTTLDEKVAQQGWKIVAFTRLIPIFPYFLVNYAFGLTRIPLWHYVLATFVAMIPWTIAYILLASNLLDLFHGRISKWFIIGVILVIVVSLIPWLFKKARGRRGQTLEF